LIIIHAYFCIFPELQDGYDRAMQDLDLSGTKTCPLCSEVIQQKAKVCPHCRHWQVKWSLANPHLQGALLGSIFFLVWICGGLFLNKLFNPEKFGPHLNEISVVSSDFSQKLTSSNLTLTVVGVITNHGKLDWKDIGVEVQFYDNSGKMIDVIPSKGSYSTFGIVAHNQSGFKVETKAARPQSDYATHKVFVRWAKEGESMF
jgi:hypothetical protein